MQKLQKRLLLALLLTGLAGSLQAEERPTDDETFPTYRLTLPALTGEDLVPETGWHAAGLSWPVILGDPRPTPVAMTIGLPEPAVAAGGPVPAPEKPTALVATALPDPVSHPAQPATPDTAVPNAPQGVSAPAPDKPVRRLLAAMVPDRIRHFFDRSATDGSVLAYNRVVRRESLAAGVDPALVHAIIATESGHENQVLSSKGAAGLMQLMPATARRFGVTNRFSPVQNIRAGARYLAVLLKMFNNDVRLAVAAYNAGEGAVLRYGGVPPFAETQRYVFRVMAQLPRMQALSSLAPQ